MQIEFHKYEGSGNDFILLDEREKSYNLSEQNIAFLCDRHFGIGADGLISLKKADGFDFEMEYFNSDGSAATFCGNGGRCIVAFAEKLGISRTSYHFRAADGIHTASVKSRNGKELQVKLEMRDAIIYEKAEKYAYLNSGTYHYVEFVDDPDSVDLISYARRIRYDNKYAPHGTNVNLVKISGNELFVRTYEKGVENETLSCGTGVTASSIAASLQHNLDRWIIHTKGGNLTVSFNREGDHFNQVYLQGPATLVFDGRIEI